MILKAMLKKEFIEMFRNYKILIIPIVFMLLAAMQPVTYYYLPDILKYATLSEGAIIQIPTPSPSETVYSIYGQLNQVGLLILVLISMGSIINEVKSGVAETILVKPIAIKNYILSKWIAYFTLTIFSTFLALIVGKYYTTQLIGPTTWSIIFKSTLIFILYLLFFIGLNLLLSSILNSGIAAGGITILIAITLGIISSFSLKFWFLPSYLLNISNGILFEQSLDNWGLSIIFTVLYILTMFYLSIFFFNKKEL